MFRVALCGFQHSRQVVEGEISAFLGASATDFLISEFETIESLVCTREYHDLYFFNQKLREDEEKILYYIKEECGANHKKMRFITYADDPITNKECSMAIDCIRRYIEYDSMYLTLEFLTDQGLRSIAISKILYFEFVNRKIRIKTQGNEYFCDDTLRNIIALVGNYSFLQPHKSFVVNLKHITDIVHYTISMNDGSTIPLSQKKSKEFRKHYKAYLEQNNAKVRKRNYKRRTINRSVGL